MRVFSATLATESNTFAPMPTGLDAFMSAGYYPAGTHPETMSLFAGPLWAARKRGRERGWELAEGLVAFAHPSGTTTRRTYERLRDELLCDLGRALPVDMVLLGLHGAMAAEGYDNCEGDLLTRVRALVGPDVVVGAELDPHAHLGEAEMRAADLLVFFKEYPHTDVAERALELLDLCTACAERRVRPTGAVVDCQMMVPMMTPHEPARSFVDRIKALEGKDGVLSISIIHGFPYADVPDLGTKVLVYTDADAPKAQALARSLAAELSGMREQLYQPRPGVDAALDEALAREGDLVVIADTADNPGGGAPGDSTFFLRRMVERGIRDAALGPLWDPVAVGMAFNAGEGATLDLRLGGKVGRVSGDPLDARCTVLALQRNLRATGLSGTPADMGDCALVRIEGAATIDVVLSSQRHQAFNTDLFTQLGCDLQGKKIVVVKSTNHFHASFSKIAGHVIYAAAPGASSLDLANYRYTRIRHPRWPIAASGRA